MLEKEIEDILNIIYVDINNIIFSQRDRIRTTSGKKIDDLISSIKEFGLLHPILLNKNYKLIAGYRRLLACKALGWNTIPAIIRKNPDELDEISIELQENLCRTDLEPYEIDIATAKWKRIYETLYPETKYLAHVKSGKRDSKGRIIKRNHVENFATWEKNNKTNKPRFTEVASKYYNVSERTIRDRVQIGEAILKESFDEETIQLYKSGKISHSKMVELDRKIRKEKDEKKTNKPHVHQDIIDLLSKTQTDKSKLKDKSCVDCRKATVASCPECGKNLIVCNKGYLVVKPINSPICGHFSSILRIK
ncbi:MAG: ParB/RepB/Spo0J family partition protein [Candidatus Hermodarchaeota archaeon]